MEALVTAIIIITLIVLFWTSIRYLRGTADNVCHGLYELTKPLPVAGELLSNTWISSLQEQQANQAKLLEEAQKK